MIGVDIDGLSLSYGDRKALAGISFRVEDGSLFGLLGPNGGGKTTLLRILATLLKPDGGSARVDGIDVVADPQSVRHRLGIVFQDPSLDEELTLEENLRTHAALYALGRSDAARRMAELLPLFGLHGRMNARVSTFSGGLKRRADIVRGLMHAPPVLLLDEPTTGLDPAARQAFWEMLELARRRERTTVIVATHVMEEAERCDRLVILDRGSVVASGSPSELTHEIGEEMLWLETDDPSELLRQIHARFDVNARQAGSRIQVSSPDAHELLGALYDTCAPLIRSATVRRPSLEDVFMVHAGRRLEEADEAFDAGGADDARGSGQSSGLTRPTLTRRESDTRST